MEIRPISDLRNKFTEISRIVHENDAPVFLTKNGYGDMVVMSVEHYERLSGSAVQTDSASSTEKGQTEVPAQQTEKESVPVQTSDDGAYETWDEKLYEEIPSYEQEQHEDLPKRGGFFGRFGRNREQED